MLLKGPLVRRISPWNQLNIESWYDQYWNFVQPQCSSWSFLVLLTKAVAPASIVCETYNMKNICRLKLCRTCHRRIITKSICWGTSPSQFFLHIFHRNGSSGDCLLTALTQDYWIRFAWLDLTDISLSSQWPALLTLKNFYLKAFSRKHGCDWLMLKHQPITATLSAKSF